MSVKYFCDICDEEMEKQLLGPMGSEFQISDHKDEEYDLNKGRKIQTINNFNFKLYFGDNDDFKLDVCKDCWTQFHDNVKFEMEEARKRIEDHFMDFLGTEFRILNS